MCGIFSKSRVSVSADQHCRTINVGSLALVRRTINRKRRALVILGQPPEVLVSYCARIKTAANKFTHPFAPNHFLHLGDARITLVSANHTNSILDDAVPSGLHT